MENVPERTVDMWINHPKLNPRYLIPALLRYNHVKRTEKVIEVRKANSDNTVFLLC
jgi:hypothetical protein